MVHGCLLSQGEFTSIDFPGARFTSAPGINSRGDIVGFFGITSVAHGFLLSGGEFTSIDFPGAIATQAYGINPRGDIVGQYYTYIDGKFHVHGFLLSSHDDDGLDSGDRDRDRDDNHRDR
jgi:hypothetical protein